jgi:hypothetical protein
MAQAPQVSLSILQNGIIDNLMKIIYYVILVFAPGTEAVEAATL